MKSYAALSTLSLITCFSAPCNVALAEPESPPASARGDYVGDCFVIKNGISALSAAEAGHRHWIVTAQNDKSKDDPTLTLVPASEWSDNPAVDALQRASPLLGCTPKSSNTTPVDLPASTLQRHGAIRRGFVYGLLTTPYKYFPSDKRVESGLPIGPYLGWRVGESGVGGTFVTAVTLGSVTAETLEADPADINKTRITGTTNLASLAAAVGVVFDITRNTNKSPFKVGLLFGKDFVNEGDNIRYAHNRKTWVALQLGFDFTDY
jgi:hypothetical protein